MLCVAILVSEPVVAEAAGDAPMVQQYVVGNGIPAAAPDNEVPGAVVGISITSDGVPVAAVLTNAGNVAIMEFAGGAWTFQDFVKTIEKTPWHSLAVEMTGKVFTDNGVPEGTPLLASALTPDGRHYSATAEGIWDDTTTPSTLIYPLEAPALSLAAEPNGALAFGTANGLYLRADANSGIAQLMPSDSGQSWELANVAAVEFDGDGHLWFASNQGVGHWSGDAWTLYPAGATLPKTEFTSMASGKGDIMWLGTAEGLYRFVKQAWVCYHGKEWLPDDHVNAVVVDSEDAAWVATNGGVSRIDASAVPKPDTASDDETKIFLQDRSTRFIPGESMLDKDNDGYLLTDFCSIAIAADGAVVVGALAMENVTLLECRDGQWSTGEFIDLVTKSLAHDYVAAQTGKVFVQLPDGDKPIVLSAVSPSSVAYIATPDAIWRRVDPAQPREKVVDVASEPLSLAVGPGGAVAVGTADALLFRADEALEFQKLYPSDANYSWAPRNVTALAFDDNGRLWFGCDLGAGVWDGTSWCLFTGAEGLPYDHFTCADAGPDGTIWFGTERGAMYFDGNAWAYRASLRWLPDDYVSGIAVDNDGTAWIVTRKGVARIERVPMTLPEKAAYFEDQVETRHTWKGFVSAAHLEERGKVETARRQIDDNDGMYTSMHGAAEAFRYAVTKDPAAKDSARRRLDACTWLVDITGIPGFPARVIVPIDWPEDLNAQYGDEYNRKKREGDPFWKLITPRFVKSADGQYRWKNDTSSDELAGHYFFYGAYYDLVAETEEEKAPVRDVVAAITDHLIRNGFELVDSDGQPTRWGRFSPEFMNSVFGWEQRGLNSMMMLSFLNVAEHVTGDPKYGEVAQVLRDEHEYHINAMLAKMYFPPGYVVPWDNNLALLSFYGLMMYEDDPGLLLMYRQALEFAWQHVSKQKNALWNVIYGACAQRFQHVADTGVYASGNVFPEAGPYAEAFAMGRMYDFDANIQDAVDTLEEMPLELIGWQMDNTHRLDIALDPQPTQEDDIGWSRVTGKAISIAERSHVRQDRDGFKLNAVEGDGWSEHEGTFFLLPYYMGQYHGFIAR